MTLRRLRVLVENLPPDSATVRARIGHNWSVDQMLLADAVDALRFWRCEWLYSHDAHPPEPDPIPRPGVESAEDRRAAQRAAHDLIMSQLKRGTNHGDG
jgi:hypothetical protein